ncbi:MAG: carotenoid biosynthesis protein [Oscillatoriaceae bacterium SKW80]|nr:carotenoid biosynthesis protein [Oscillatoriaceae bacterium SKYG93]MCX8121372.1 carotenoid biosynthesis protein [Oscillatoriaceae bacterium SKW80]MDW8451951.1 carotenoid biosynthesis protein [Oscillatoriaceae cyanobacterium SKYGB_i_bin93]HIK29494.1 carotenoid biosynthesis protein [Oscillatoriaceae cyanobacterium M7585_C2015_266]
MKGLIATERVCLIGHIGAMVFGVAGLLLVLPHPDFVINLSPIGQMFFQLGMSGGGVIHILLGATAVAIYAYRNLGVRLWLTFMVPAVLLSLGSELLGTSTGFPFGHYRYLSGLGYKIAGLVPFTIPLSWFYMGLVCYLLARTALQKVAIGNWLRQIAAIALGAILLTAWDLVLDPAMSQTTFPFWQFQEIGAFFGMPYRNLTGWLGTGALFMSVATLLWGKTPIVLTRPQLNLPLTIYIVNFAFGALITVGALDARFWIPTALSLFLGVVPAIIIWWVTKPSRENEKDIPPDAGSLIPVAPLEVAAK